MTATSSRKYLGRAERGSRPPSDIVRCPALVLGQSLYHSPPVAKFDPAASHHLRNSMLWRTTGNVQRPEQQPRSHAAPGTSAQDSSTIALRSALNSAFAASRQ